jgi:uncharacterized protein YbgA (DUF1722 family)
MPRNVRPRIVISKCIEHAACFFKKGVSAMEKAYFADTLAKYRKNRAPLRSPVSVIKAWIVRFGQTYLAGQAFFEPYPDELVSVADSGTGRKLR